MDERHPFCYYLSHIKMSVPGFQHLSVSVFDLLPDEKSVSKGEKGEKGEKGDKGDQGDKGDSALLIDQNHNLIADPSLLSQLPGQWNTILGVDAGKTNGNNNVYIGYQAKPSIQSASNEIVLGNSSITALRCKQTSIAGLSDQRDKTNIATISGKESLAFINQLRPVEFTWDQREWYDNRMPDGSKKGDTDIGFIAQDILACDNRDSYRIVATSNPERYEVAPARLIPLLVAAIQELSIAHTQNN